MKFSFWTLLGAHGAPVKLKKSSASWPCCTSFRGAGGDSVGGAAGLSAFARSVATDDRRTSAARTALTPSNFFGLLCYTATDRRIWVAACMLGIAGVLFAVAFSRCRRRRLDCFAAYTWVDDLSATQDVAIDSYSVGLIKREEEGAATASEISFIE